MAAFTHLCASSKTADGINGRDNLIRHRDASYGHAVTRRLAAMGIRDHPTELPRRKDS
jgi:hypothetical protein